LSQEGLSDRNGSIKILADGRLNAKCGMTVVICFFSVQRSDDIETAGPMPSSELPKKHRMANIFWEPVAKTQGYERS
jgi:hypothetical protein